MNKHTARGRWAVIAAGLVLLVGFVAGWGLAATREHERNQTQAATLPLTDELLALCSQDGNPRAAALADLGLCQRAATARNTIPNAPAVPGPAGAPGANGLNGVPGATGATGAAGDQGPTGPQGPRGLRGPRGYPGKNGENGAPGATGTSIVGPQGPAGPQGDTGPAGTAKPGTYSCGDGKYLAGFTVTDDGDVKTDCRDLPASTGGQPSSGPTDSPTGATP